MKEVINEFNLIGLTLKHKLIVLYFGLSICSLCIADESPIWAILLVIANFANAVRLVKKVPIKDEL